MIDPRSHSLGRLLAEKKIPTPSLHVVLGSGLSPAFASVGTPPDFIFLEELSFAQVTGLLPSTAPGHRGALRFYVHTPTSKIIVFQVGRLHGFEGHETSAVVAPLVQSALAGTPRFLLSNAAGSLNPSFLPGSLMVIRDHVNLTGKNPLTGLNPCNEQGTPYGPRFADMSRAYHPEASLQLKSFLGLQGFTVHEGTYLGVHGPTFETPAEVRLFSNWGLGAVGMSTVWETLALNYLGRQVTAFSFISNLGCGLVANQPLSHEEVEDEGRKLAPRLLTALFAYAAEDLC